MTHQFLAAARREPEPVTRHVQDLLRAAPVTDGPRASSLSGGQLLGWSRPGDRLELFALAPDASASTPFPLADMSLGELRDLGIPDHAILEVQRARRAADLDALPVSESVKERLRFRILQKTVSDDLALERRAESLGHLEQYLCGEITELLLNLDETQRPIVDLPVPGAILVRGVAGSGKTAVALHRVHAMVRRGSRLVPPRILYLTYNRALATAAQDLLESLGVKPGQVEVLNLHRWCKQFLGAANPRALVDGVERDALIADARARVRKTSRSSSLWRYPDPFWSEEIHRIQGQVLGGREQYLAMPRHGAVRPLDVRLRELVWLVNEAYEQICAERRVADWDRVARTSLERLSAMGDCLPAYDHVFVDEGQDFTVVAMRIAARLAGSPGNLMVAFDPAQSIYERGFRWKSCGITAHGCRSFSLRKNHRNSIQILQFARPLLEVIRTDPAETDGDGDEDLIDPVSGRRAGDPPCIVAAMAGSEAAHVARLVKQALATGHLPPQNIAVLCFKKYKLKRLEAALRSEGVLVQSRLAGSELSLTDPSVKLLTMHSAKGLEFPAVFLVASARDFSVPKAQAEPADRAAFLARARKVMYMAMTRALSQLTLVHDAAEGSPLDALLSAHALPASVRPVPVARAPRPAAPEAKPVYAQGYTKFHTESCDYLGKTARKTRFASREEALRKGLKPCRSCSP